MEDNPGVSLVQVPLMVDNPGVSLVHDRLETGDFLVLVQTLAEIPIEVDYLH